MAGECVVSRYNLIEPEKIKSAAYQHDISGGVPVAVDFIVARLAPEPLARVFAEGLLDPETPAARD
jgi:hypothetical protein